MAPLKLGAESMLSEERKEEAEAILSSLGIVNGESPAREVSQL